MPAWVSIGNTHAGGPGESNLTSLADPPTPASAAGLPPAHQPWSAMPKPKRDLVLRQVRPEIRR
jgi:hypothetical protein